jgi:predicted aspartyl protease
VKFSLAHPTKPLILVPVIVQGAGPFQFALDTGSSTTVLSPQMSKQLKLDSTVVTNMTAAGGSVSASIARLSSLAVAGQTQSNLPIVIAEFIEMISDVAGVQLDGILGYNYLQNFKVTIDYPNGILSLERISY